MKKLGNKIYQDLDAFQKKHKTPYDEWNKGNYKVIIGIGDNLKLEGMVKSMHIDLSSGAISYTLTHKPIEAMLFNQKVSSMLYHFLDTMPETQGIGHHHYPISIT